jgi:hypothetical protein
MFGKSSFQNRFRDALPLCRVENLTLNSQLSRSIICVHLLRASPGPPRRRRSLRKRQRRGQRQLLPEIEMKSTRYRRPRRSSACPSSTWAPLGVEEVVKLAQSGKRQPCSRIESTVSQGWIQTLGYLRRDTIPPHTSSVKVFEQYT